MTSTGLTLTDNTMYVNAGGTATKTKVDTGGYLIVSNGGTAIETRIDEKGICSALGAVNNVWIESKGRLDLNAPASGGGKASANNIIIYAGGTMNISSGGTAANVTANSGGSVFIKEASVTGLTMGQGAKYSIWIASDSLVQGIYGDNAFEMADASVSDFTIDSECNLFIGDGVKANAITVGGDGDYTVESGGTATSTTVIPRGFLYVNAGGTANSVFMGGGGCRLNGTINYAQLTNLCWIAVSSGGVARSATVDDHGYIDVSSGGTAIKTTLNALGSLNVFASGMASNATVNDGGKMTLSGGTGSIIKVNSSGALILSDGGSATLYEDAAAHDVVVAGGTLEVRNGAYIFQTSKGKTVTSNIIVSNGGKLNINGGWVEGALISGCKVEIASDGSMFSATVANGTVEFNGNGLALETGWTVVGTGDFDGNGSHDIAMINDVGVVGIWGVNDGYLSSWSILSAVTSEWQLAGVGDFNGDGTDDIAWSNTDTGLTGYWQINDKTLTTWSNIATIG